jgi:hypothetical protein
MPRTTKGADGGKRYPLNMRTTRETRERLEAAASANGRSLAQEVEARLERSFTEEMALGGPQMLRMGLNMISSFVMAGRYSAAGEPDWIDDSAHYAAAGAGVIDALLIGRTDEALLIEAWLSKLLTRKRQRLEEKK